MAFEAFSTGLVVSVNQKNGTCTILRSEGGYLYDVPVLNTTGGGPNSTDSKWVSGLRGNIVVLIPIHDVYYVLATVPTFVKAGAEIE